MRLKFKKKILNVKNQKNKTTTKTKTTKTPKEIHKDKKQKKQKREPLHFSEKFFTCILPVSLSKTVGHNPFMLLKLCYLLNAIFF